MKRILAVLAGLIISGLALTSTPAHAGTGNQFCTTGFSPVCINAWGGGPWVKVYTSQGTSNNDFTAGYDATLGVWYLEFTGGGSWNGQCIGDAYNSSGDARASLDPCPSGSNSGGWGTHFQLDTSDCNGGSGEEAFKNIHWPGGFLYPSGRSNGNQYYLNTGAVFCYTTFGAA